MDSVMNNVEFGKFLKSARLAANMTQAQLAACMNVTPPTVSKWESGKLVPRLETVQKLSQVLKFSTYPVPYLLSVEDLQEKSRNDVTPVSAPAITALDEPLEEIVSKEKNVTSGSLLCYIKSCWKMVFPILAVCLLPVFIKAAQIRQIPDVYIMNSYFSEDEISDSGQVFCVDVCYQEEIENYLLHAEELVSKYYSDLDQAEMIRVTYYSSVDAARSEDFTYRTFLLRDTPNTFYTHFFLDEFQIDYEGNIKPTSMLFTYTLSKERTYNGFAILKQYGYSDESKQTSAIYQKQATFQNLLKATNAIQGRSIQDLEG